MVHVMQADLLGKLDDFRPLQFPRVEWWEESPRIALLRYSMGEHEEALGLRLDLDKKAILDSVQDAYLDNVIEKNVETIWQVVVEEQSAQK